MKLNGALKPRQGASKQGSSPGAVFKKNRIKRYFEVNKNVVNGQALNACGAKNKNSFNDNNVINSNYISINNQQPATTSLSQQLAQKGKSGVKSSRRIYNSLSKRNFSTSKRIKKQINSVAKACRKIVNNRKSNANFQQQIAVAAVKTAKADSDTANLKNIKRKINIQIDSKPEAVTNITTTRQNKHKKLKEKSTKNKNHTNKGAERITKQVNKPLNENNRHNNINKNNRKKVNKFLFVRKLNANPNLITIIMRLLIQLKLLLFSSFLHAIKYFNVQLLTNFVGSGKATFWVVRLGFRENSMKMIRASQLLVGLFESIYFKNARGLKSPIALYMVIFAATASLLPLGVVGDDGETFFPINGIETTTPEFDYASRGQKKFGDKCDNTLECGFPGSICDPKKKSCQCTEDLPVTNHIDKCGKEAAVNESCFFNEQCEVKYFQTECRDQRCVCRFDMTPIWMKDGSVECKGRGDKKGPETYVDPAMIGVLIGMALMFIIICVVLRLFSQARWRENRTIFNTPNPRLMNVSLLRESKLLHGQERRGSRMSVRAPSRQPSMVSLRPHSPNPSLGKTGSRSNSHGSSASATSLKSTRSNCVSPAGITVGNNSHHERKGSTYQPHQHHHPQQQKLQPLQQEEEQHLAQPNIISNPVAETVTVEIIESEKLTKSTK